MTNLQVLQGSAALNYPIDESAFMASLVKNGIEPAGEFTQDNQEAIDLAISDLALTLIFSVKKLQDDGYSVELQDISALWALRAWYRKKWGLPDDSPSNGPVLRDASSKW